MAKILVIDDENTLRHTISTILEFAGYEVLDAADGRAGAKLASEHMPDLIVSDIVMPGLDGYGLLSTLRQNAETAAIPVIFVTALAERQAMRQGMELGADDYLVKPFAPADLLNTVKVRLERQAVLAARHDTTLNVLRKNIIYALPHELRTPLHLILGFAQILEMHHHKASSEDILQATGAIIKAGHRLEHLIENYLAYAQMELIATDTQETQALRNHFTEDPVHVVTSTASGCADLYDRSRDLLLDTYGAPLRIAQESLAKIVSEVVDNSLKFSKPGTPIHIRSLCEDQYFVLHICDKGRGMSAEQIKNVGAYMQFERAFFEQQGLGLGLAIVRRLVELHNGQLEIESTLDEGTSVHIRLPL
jgi:two-component system sensor histidine kinase/response regulator